MQKYVYFSGPVFGFLLLCFSRRKQKKVQRELKPPPFFIKVIENFNSALAFKHVLDLTNNWGAEGFKIFRLTI